MTRRPLLYGACGAVAAILISHYICSAACMAFAGAIACVFLLGKRNGYFNEAKAVIIVFLAFCIASAVSYGIETKAFEKAHMALTDMPAEQSIVVTGTVSCLQNRQNSTGKEYIEFVLSSDKGRLLTKCYESRINIIPGDRVIINGNVEIPQGKRNPGGFDYALYLKSRRICGIIKTFSVETAENNKSLWGKIKGGAYRVKNDFVSKIEKNVGKDTAATIRAIMFGEKGELDREITEAYQRNGTAHILAVSGLHIGIIYGFIIKLWTLIGTLTGGLICGKRGRLFFLATALFFGYYMLLADYSPSVVRAGCMVLIHCLSRMINVRYDLVNSGLLVGLLVILQNPYMLFNMGFQMSFLAVLTLNLVLPFVKSIYSGILLSGIVIQLGLGPFLIYNFNVFTLTSVLINVPVIFLAGFIVPLGLIDMALMNTGMFGISAELTRILCKTLNGINQLTEIEGVTNFNVSSPPLWLMFFYYLVLLVFMSEEGRLKIIRLGREGTAVLHKSTLRIRYICKTAVALVIISLIFSSFAGAGFDKCNLTFVDVGQGDCIFISEGKNFLGRKETFLIDGGGSENYSVGEKILQPYVLKNRLGRIEGAFVTHLHTDHYRGICRLAKEGMIRTLYVYEGCKPLEEKILDDTGLERKNIVYIYGGEEICLFSENHLLGRESVDIKVLWPERKSKAEYMELMKDEKNENEGSLILKVSFSKEDRGGKVQETSLLVTGDMGIEGERELMENQKDSLRADILKVGHHGSKNSTSEDFIEAVSPKVGVIQVGKNNYGHPHRDVLDRLCSKNIKIYRNDLHGAVGFIIKNGIVKRVKVML